MDLVPTEHNDTSKSAKYEYGYVFPATCHNPRKLNDLTHIPVESESQEIASTGSPGERQTPELKGWDKLETAQSWSMIDLDHDSDLHPGLKALGLIARAIASNNSNSNSNATTTYPNPLFPWLDDIYSMLPEPSKEEKFLRLAFPIVLLECDRSPGFPKFRKLVAEYESTICEGLKVRADKYREKTGQQCEEPKGKNQTMDEEISQDRVGRLLVAAGNILLLIYHESLMKSRQELNDLKASLSKIPQEMKKLQEESDSKYDTEQLNTDKRADKWDEAVSHQIEQEMKRLNEASERVEQEIKLNRAKQKALLENLTVVSNTVPSLSSPLLRVHSYRVVI